MPIGYPVTMCGEHNYKYDPVVGRGLGCTECCYGQAINTTFDQGQIISKSLGNINLQNAAGRAVTRMELAVQGLTRTVIDATPAQLPALESVFKRYMNIFIDTLLIDGRKLQILTQNQNAVLRPNFESLDALGNANYAQLNTQTLNETKLTTEGTNIMSILIQSVCRQVLDLHRPLSEAEVMKRVKFMMDPNLKRAEFPCPYLGLETGECLVYKNRPYICRFTGSYYPEVPGCSGCGANFLFSTLNSSSTPITRGNYQQFQTRYFSPNSRIPIDFFAVRELAARNQSFALEPLSLI